MDSSSLRLGVQWQQGLALHNDVFLEEIGRPMTMELTEEEIGLLTKLSAAMDILRSLDHKIPTSYISAILNVAISPGNELTHYARLMNIIEPIAARIILEIGQKSGIKEEPLGLVDARVSPASLHDKQYFLTDRGLELARKLAAAIR